METREKRALTDCWNIEALYPSLEEWKKEFTTWAREGQTPRWPEIAQYRGKLKEGPLAIKSLLDNLFQIERQINKLFVYAHLRHA